MDLALVGQDVSMFAVTNVDDIVLLALFFSQALAGQRHCHSHSRATTTSLFTTPVRQLGHVALPVTLPGIGVLILVR